MRFPLEEGSYRMGSFDQNQLEAFRVRIAAELEELNQLSRSTGADRAPVELDQQSVGRLSRMDAMQMQAMAEASERRRRGRITRLEHALRRLETSEFAICHSCGEEISLGRLNFEPAANLCIQCADR